MRIHHLRKTTQGSGGNMSMRGAKKSLAMPYKTSIGKGITPEVYSSDLAGVRPTRVLQNIKIRKPTHTIPKKYITFE